MDKPIKTAPTSPEKAQEVLDRFARCSRDHLLTMENDAVVMAIAKNWKEIDAGLNQALRDMSKACADGETEVNLNAILVAGQQLISRMHQFAEKGADLLSTTD